MDASNSHRSSYKGYPYLTKGEFAEVCHYLDRRYRRATLGPLRKDWRLHVHTALELAFEPGSGRTTFLQITRPLENRTAAEDELAAKMGGVSLGEEQEMQLDADDMMIKMEELDKEVVPKRPSRPHFQAGHVIYEIHYHPTYRSPCLWFSLHGLPGEESPVDIESVFRYLVPEQLRDSLRYVGPIGAISIDHHPITGLPSFFVHPCAIGEAMAGFDCAKQDYLMVWIGLVGGHFDTSRSSFIIAILLHCHIFVAVFLLLFIASSFLSAGIKTAGIRHRMVGALRRLRRKTKDLHTSSSPKSLKPCKDLSA
ncbi:uncharacterized protein F4812DRAFT_451217 [Daldinia caldariorum]|uniref:uncharacterized protein n=1 Tax=Daldinia caldariorum TaxID=326644 RepID=UPI0020072EAA|nr:uncharacterized protein F4812DRAFT_451217 [Daldinia caldariorum]KAI1467360.1 hypothetical protein F4812DRAFT_451217 [Daldinia caldariorum]